MVVNKSLPERCFQFDVPKDDVAAALAAVARGGQGRPSAWYIGGASFRYRRADGEIAGCKRRLLQAATVPPGGAARRPAKFSIGRSAAELLRYGRVAVGLGAFVFGIGMRSQQIFGGAVATALSFGALIV